MQDREENISEFFNLIIEKQAAGIKSRFTIENIHTVKKNMYEICWRNYLKSYIGWNT